MTHNQYRSENSHVKSIATRGAPFSNPRTIRRVFNALSAERLQQISEQKSLKKFKGRSHIDTVLQIATMGRS